MSKDKHIKITADFSTETLKARRAWIEVFLALNENNFSPRIHYPAEISFKIDKIIKIFHNKQKLKQYMTTKSPLEKILQRILHRDDERKQKPQEDGEVSNHRRRKDK
jgi:predicted component of type VI protein secretion system